MPSTEARRRERRMELRTTDEERDLIDAAVRESNTDLTAFVISSALIQARRVLADRRSFTLTDEQLAAWEELNAGPARVLPDVAALLSRPSPFSPR